MDELETVKNLLAGGKYQEAGRLLNSLLQRNRDNDELWYFLGVLAVKLKNYDLAHEHLERAISLRKKPAYLWFKGMAHMETLEIKEAIEVFSELLEIEGSSVDANFFLAICYLLFDDPRSERHMKKAYKLDKKRTKQLLKNFFSTFIGGSPEIRGSLKTKIEKELEGL